MATFAKTVFVGQQAGSKVLFTGHDACSGVCSTVARQAACREL